MKETTKVNLTTNSSKHELQHAWDAKSVDRVRIDTVRRGTFVSDVRGDVCKVTRHTTCVTHVTEHPGGRATFYANCAEVIVLKRGRELR